MNLNHVTNNRDISSNKSEIENFEFQIGELHLQNEELLAELNVNSYLFEYNIYVSNLHFIFDLDFEKFA